MGPSAHQLESCELRFVLMRNLSMAAMVGVVLVVCVACSKSDTITVPSETLVFNDEEADANEDEPRWEAGEQEAVMACSSEKLGYELTQEIMDDDVVFERASESEAAWEQERWIRAYEQCLFEVEVARIDMSDPSWQWAYRHAYALDPDGSPVMDDPLAPWPGESARDD